MFKFLPIIVTITWAAIGAIAQEPSKSDSNGGATSDYAKRERINGGVLNGKATSLPKPSYPAAARAVGADGPVSVQVLIDETGTVVSATAVNGHPLLRAAAANAAREAKFTPTLLAGTPVKVMGVIVYNFVGELYPARLGHDLGFAERSGTFDANTNADFLAGVLPKEWLVEKETLRSLKYEPYKTPADPTPSTPQDDAPRKDKFIALPSAASVSSMRRLDQRSISAVRDLKPLLSRRFESSDSAVWSFELGWTLGELAAEIDDPSKLSANLDNIESLVARAPASVSEGNLGVVRDFVRKAKSSSSDTDEIRTRAYSLSRLRF